MPRISGKEGMPRISGKEDMLKNHILLTQSERDLFATYLDQTAVSNDALAFQLDKLEVSLAMSEKYYGEAHAARVIAQMLRETENG